jgi:hypothetical protein
VSESDSFLSEVTEEVRRDRFYAFLRRWGWLLALAALLIVGGAGFNEWRKARERAAAEAAGDALRAALTVEDPAARAEALAGLAPGPYAALARISEAGALRAAGDAAGAGALLGAVAADPATPQPWRDLAALQRVMILGSALPSGERLAALDALAVDGAPFRLLALEQRALARIEAGETETARADLAAILAAGDAPQDLRSRVGSLIEATGGPLAEPTADTPEAAPDASGG